MDIKVSLSMLDRIKLATLKSSWRMSGVMNIEVSSLFNGQRFVVPIHHRVGFWFVDQKYLRLRFSDIASVLPVALASKDGVVVDIGTNIGLFLYLIAAFDRSRKYVGFEPNIHAAAYLQRFVDRNELCAHTVIPVGLSNRKTVCELMLSHEVDVMATVVEAVRAKENYSITRKVLLQTGDEILPKVVGEDEAIALIKIDVEGAEKEVLNGLSATITKHLPVVIFEVLPSSDDAMQDYVSLHKGLSKAKILEVQKERAGRTDELQEFFRARGYRFFKMHQSGQLSACDSLFEEHQENRLEQNFLAVQEDEACRYSKLLG